jgi:prepilin-type N-terminal cleavage/methylation domain-containing protein
MSENRKAFTLIELMVVVVIIVMLAMLASTAYFGAMQSAREVRTIGIIAKLDAAISDIYETYEFRFEHIENALDPSSRSAFDSNLTSMSEVDLTKLKRKLMYDLMRMEMPSTRQEALEPPSTSITIQSVNYRLANSAVQQVYHDIINSAGASSSTPSFATESAELLYLIIANLDPEALENFTASEIGDTDGNGLSEFIDGWGRPIAFLRFAPGFIDTDRQPDVKKIVSSLSSTALDTHSETFDVIQVLTGISVDTTNSAIINAKDLIVSKWQDPFDPDMLNGESWFLYPVVVSAGRDGKFGVVIARTNTKAPIFADAEPTSDPKESLTDPFSVGAFIGTPDSSSRHNDNIHNHTNFR